MDIIKNKELLLKQLEEEKHPSGFDSTSEELSGDKEVVLSALNDDLVPITGIINNKQKKDSDILPIIDDENLEIEEMSVYLHGDEFNQIIIMTEKQDTLLDIVNNLIQKYPNEEDYLTDCIQDNLNIFYIEQSEEMNTSDIINIDKNIIDIIKGKGIIINKIDFPDVGEIELQYYFGDGIKNQSYENYEEYYGEEEDIFRVYNYKTNKWTVDFSKEIKRIIETCNNDLSQREIEVLKKLNLL